MAYCGQCGEILKSNNFCMRCGKNSKPHLPNEPLKQGDLEEVTDAVRQFNDGASDEMKKKKYGQQKWGLFETNYQRSKGITLEESLQEIERFCSEGISMEDAIEKVAKSQPKESDVGGKQYREKLQQAIEKKMLEDAEKEQKKKDKQAGKRRSSSKSGFNPMAGFKPSGGSSGGSKKFGPNSTNGQAFFEQFKKKEDRKYQPQYR